MFRRIGCRLVLDLGNAESSDLETWAIVRNLELGSGTLVAFEFGGAELDNEFPHTLSARQLELADNERRHVEVANLVQCDRSSLPSLYAQIPNAPKGERPAICCRS